MTKTSGNFFGESSRLNSADILKQGALGHYRSFSVQGIKVPKRFPLKVPLIRISRRFKEQNPRGHLPILCWTNWLGRFNVGIVDIQKSRISPPFYKMFDMPLIFGRFCMVYIRCYISLSLILNSFIQIGM